MTGEQRGKKTTFEKLISLHPLKPEDVFDAFLRTPPPLPEYRLEDLVAQITDENRHEEVDFGALVGKEARS
jgi:hypothetical protein